MSKPNQTFFVYEYLRKEISGGSNKIQKKAFLTALATAIKKDPTTSIRKHCNELTVHEKIVRTTIKQDLSLDLNSLHATSDPNIGSLKTAIEEEWNKMCKEFILNACKSFRRLVNRIIEK